MKAILYWLVTLPLYGVCAAILGTYSYLCLAGPGRVLPGSAAIVILLSGTAILVLPWIIKKNAIQGKIWLLRLPLTLAMALFTAYLLVDMAPPLNDYTESDIIPATPDMRDCYQTIKPWIDNDQEKIHIDRTLWASKDFLVHINDHAKEIEDAWQAIADDREIIQKLAGYDLIIAVDPDSVINMETPFLHFSSLLDIQTIYTAYAALKIASGEPGDAIGNLSQLYDVARKGEKGSVVLIHKMLWAAMISKIADSVSLISTMDSTDMPAKQMMKDRFVPLTPQETDMTKTMIGEYLFGKNVVVDVIKPENFLGSIFSFEPPSREPEGISKYLSALVYAFGCKKNKSLNDYKDYIDLVISGAQSTPPDLSGAARWFDDYIKSPDLTNLALWVFWTQNQSDFGNYADRLLKVKAKTDLLAIHLHTITGDTLVLKDIYTGRPYILRIDNGVMSTPGKDGVFDTEDDVSLGKKPTA